jgi:hypothetical protein
VLPVRSLVCQAALLQRGEGFMKLFESGIRAIMLSQGAGTRWLRDELDALKVKIPLSDGCVEALVREADRAAWQARTAGSPRRAYRTLLREQLMVQAALVRRWTCSDEKLDLQDATGQAFVGIARKYALPRPWKLTEPVAVESRHLRPPAWRWATGLDTRQAQI